MDWLQAPVLWEWTRTAGAALLGAVVGGAFTIWAQALEARAQARRDITSRASEAAEARRADVRDDARALFRAYIDLSEEISRSSSTDDGGGSAAWAEAWFRIYSQERRAAIRVLTGLIPDAEIREFLAKVNHYTFFAEDYSARGNKGSRFRYDHRNLVRFLTLDAIDAMASYLRGDRYESQRLGMWAQFDEPRDLFDTFGLSDDSTSTD